MPLYEMDEDDKKVSQEQERQERKKRTEEQRRNVLEHGHLNMGGAADFAKGFRKAIGEKE